LASVDTVIPTASARPVWTASKYENGPILGIVGAGGIGFEVQAAFSQFQFHRVLTIVVEIVAMVTIVARLSALIRARLIREENGWLPSCRPGV
jgi:phosphonate transport system permease protein